MHALAYSFIAIQILVLATYYPIIYWNCACLITNSGGDEYQEIDDDDDDDDDNDEESPKKKKIKNTDYGKVATAIGNFQNRGIKVMPPNINTSGFTFSPNITDNSIIYGLRGISRISSTLIHDIIDNRPYGSLEDFLQKIKINKTQILNLIKAGAFDELEDKPREEILHDYLATIADKKQRLTLQNMQMLITKDLIPDEMAFYGKLFSFNKFLKTCKHGGYYELNAAAVSFIEKYFSVDLIEDGVHISQTKWDNVYKKAMDPMRVYLKDHKDEMLAALNESLYQEVKEKYAEGDISTWEMSSLSFYYHDHELAEYRYDFDNFYDLPEEPEIDYSFTSKDGKDINIYRIHTIIGTVIDKDKVRNTVTLLTPTGVVLVKIYKNQFALYDKQVSEMGSDGHKHVLEASWFKRGTLLRIQGIRREMNFIPKKTKQSVYPVIMKITKTKDGLTYQQERVEVEQ